MANGKFLGGVIVGIAAGVAAKFVYDNKEEIVDIAVDNYYAAKDQAVTIVEHSKEKAASAKEYAMDQYNDLKGMIFADEEDDDDDVFVEEAEEDEEEVTEEQAAAAEAIMAENEAETAEEEAVAEELGDNLDEFKLENGLI